MSIYQEKGYKNREDYFNELALEYNLPIEVIWLTAEFLGKNEDFDGLISSLEMCYFMCGE